MAARRVKPQPLSAERRREIDAYMATIPPAVPVEWSESRVTCPVHGRMLDAHPGPPRARCPHTYSDQLGVAFPLCEQPVTVEVIRRWFR
jgi:hypothetical protein